MWLELTIVPVYLFQQDYLIACILFVADKVPANVVYML